MGGEGADRCGRGGGGGERWRERRAQIAVAAVEGEGGGHFRLGRRRLRTNDWTSVCLLGLHQADQGMQLVLIHDTAQGG